MTETSHVPDSLLEKIQKLLRLKENSAASQGEIENASAMIQALLLKHNLSMSTVESHGAKHDPKITNNIFNLNGKQTRHEAGWVNMLYAVIADHNMCKTLNRRGINGKDDMGEVRIIGSMMNIEIVQYVVLGLIDKIRSMAKNAWSHYNGIEKRNTFIRGYLRGCVMGINDRLNTEKAERKAAEHLSLENRQMGLMIINNDQALVRYINENINVRAGSAKKGLSGQTGMSMGYAAGQGMSISHKVGQKRLN